MDHATFAAEAECEATHWWFVGRRTLLKRELQRAGISPDVSTLDIGTSTGTNLRMLSELGFSKVEGLDYSLVAAQFCATKGLGAVTIGDACHIPFAADSFDLVLATDIIEHVADHERAIREMARVLRTNGRIVFTVPAFPSLWGLQDRVAHHQRRYRLQPLLRLLRGSGLVPMRWFHFNFLLFAPIWAARRVIDLLGINVASENEINSPLINRLLGGIFATDVALAPVARVPFGVSIYVMATKP